jgi:hypothetical protein
MQYRRCKCGARERWDSGETVHPCQGCEKCQTTFAQHPDDHKPLEPHQWAPRFDPQTGGPDRPICAVCHAGDREWVRSE